MRQVIVKFESRFLTKDHKDHCLDDCHDLKIQVNDDQDILSKVSTGEKTWIYGYGAETKQQS